jgi:hypothetical protein
MMQRRARIALVAVAAVVLLLALGVRLVLQPQRVASLVLGQVGRALGLEITAVGASEYRLRGTPMLVVRQVVARQPGAATPILTADRIHIALPWSTLRARGRELVATRIELDSPVLDLPALQAWLATRPPGERRLPTLGDGLRIRDGRIHNDGWDVDGLHVDLPSLHPERALRARLRGRYLDEPLRVPFDVAVALVRPAALLDGSRTGFAARGSVAVERGGEWRMPGALALSGPLAMGEDGPRIVPAHIGLSARYRSLPRDAEALDLPFALGLHGPLRIDEATLTLAPAGIALHGDADVVPDFEARGALALGTRLVVQLEGAVAAWPAGWPALPPPLGQSRSPLPFRFDYAGRSDLADIARLRLQRDGARVDTAFHAFEVVDWIDRRDDGSPLPPIDAIASVPRMEVAGAQLEGIELELDAPSVPGSAAP